MGTDVAVVLSRFTVLPLRCALAESATYGLIIGNYLEK